MRPSHYRVQIVDAETHKVVYHDLPGMAAEAELIENLKTRLRAKGVGLKSADHVIADLDDAFHDLLDDLKKVVPPK